MSSEENVSVQETARDVRKITKEIEQIQTILVGSMSNPNSPSLVSRVVALEQQYKESRKAILDIAGKINQTRPWYDNYRGVVVLGLFVGGYLASLVGLSPAELVTKIFKP